MGRIERRYTATKGLRISWNREDREACHAAHKVARQQIAELDRGGERQPEWYYESLRSLVEQGYSLTDIGVMVGVSRESIRQHMVRYGWWSPTEFLGDRADSGTYACFRIWDDRQDRFVPVSATELEARIASVEHNLVKARRRKNLTRVRREQVMTLRKLAADLGRTPTVRELGAELWPDLPVTHWTPKLSRYWRGAGRVHTNRVPAARSHERGMDVLWRVAGFRFRPHGQCVDLGRRRKWGEPGASTFGAFLRTARQDAGFSQAAIAKTIGVSAATICNWEFNKTTPDGNNCAKILRIFPSVLHLA